MGGSIIVDKIKNRIAGREIRVYQAAHNNQSELDQRNNNQTIKNKMTIKRMTLWRMM